MKINYSIKKFSYILTLLFLVVPVSYFYFTTLHQRYSNISSYSDCVKAGFPRLLTYPETCKMPGKTFTNESQKILSSENLSKNTLDQLSSIHASSTDDLYKNMDYYFAGQKLKIKDGVGSLLDVSKGKQNNITFNTFSEPYYFDINGDTATDTVFLLKTSLASKDYYYITCLISLHTGFSGIGVQFLDESIQNVTISSQENVLLISYSKSGSKSSYLKKYRLLDGSLQEIKD
jgi:hypothetical protein